MRMGNDAYQLQGRSGVQLLIAGDAFSGRSAGLLVAEEATFDFDVLKPDGVTSDNVALTAAPVGFFPGGTVITCTVDTGKVLVYPLDNDYTVV